MLKSIRLENYRAYKDTGEVSLKRLNVFLGANNAGKTSFGTAVEAFFKAHISRGQRGPLPLQDMPTLTSFDSVLRKHWSPKARRPKFFKFGYSFTGQQSDAVASVEISFECSSSDNIPVAEAIRYDVSGKRFTLSRDVRSASTKYTVKSGGKQGDSQEVLFHGLLPFVYRFQNRNNVWTDMTRVLMESELFFGSFQSFEVVNPSRPVPRSVYVLDDPNLSSDDKELLSYLIDIFSSQSKAAASTKQLIVENLAVLGLAIDFDVATVSKKTSTKIVSLRFSPTNKRHKVTIADVGFGVSQVLPLVVKDARSNGGVLIAYQPEVHLHPYAQSRLADIFVASVTRGNQVFVETHSPELILRLQKLIADGSIDGKDVGVFCFENSAGNGKISAIDFSKDGSPSMKWPAGFLDTSLNLARDLAVSRNRGG